METGLETLHAMIGAALRTWREQCHDQKGERQEIVALAARRWGLPWSANTVAQIESGRRHLTLEEFFLLPSALSDLGQPVSWTDLLLPPSDTRITVTPLTSTSLTALHHLLERKGLPDPADRSLFNTPHDRQAEAFADHSSGQKPSVPLPVSDVAFSVTELERKAARKLKTKAAVIATCAWKLWRHSFTDERERRLVLAGHDLTVPRTAQALRGAITRGLLEELLPLVKRPSRTETRKKRGKRKGRSHARQR